MKKQTLRNIDLFASTVPYILGAILAGIFYYNDQTEYFWYTVLGVFAYRFAKEVVPNLLVHGRRFLSSMNRYWYLLFAALVAWSLYQFILKAYVSSSFWLVGNIFFLCVSVFCSMKVYRHLRNELKATLPK